jgi:FkbM family methyltransferase
LSKSKLVRNIWARMFNRMRREMFDRLGRKILGVLREKALHISEPLEIERAERIFYLRYLQPGMIVFDVGAYIGELTLLFSKFVGEHGQVHAFEASARNFEKLKIVCQLSRRKNIVLNHLVLSEREGVAKVYVYDDAHSSWCSLADRRLEDYGITVKPVGVEYVESMTIDAYCDKTGIDRIDLLKIDVEGAEYQVLLGARRMLERRAIRCCVFEFGQTTFDMGNNPDEIEVYLTQMGYQIKNLVKGDPIFPGRRSAKAARFSMHIAVPRT